MAQFYTYHNLQGSQTWNIFICEYSQFYTYHNLQGSQTSQTLKSNHQSFYTYHNLQGSQTLVFKSLSEIIVLHLS